MRPNASNLTEGQLYGLSDMVRALEPVKQEIQALGGINCFVYIIDYYQTGLTETDKLYLGEIKKTFGEEAILNTFFVINGWHYDKRSELVRQAKKLTA